ncbi:hypothetical protein Glove_144g143 [Diversispora epigaea]|uniref:Zn(2)-C6 fungal-type domain-containing protein n=1 Tax=Diversispora epigaea TaxID=1348612 RepID=A0A397J0I4_9GLOM|nr:hypothetical protein Glove_144g143 [Diversispora epigaea]
MERNDYISHACDNCKNKKRKCNTSGNGYACQRCIDSDIRCRYSPHKPRGRPGKNTNSSPQMDDLSDSSPQANDLSLTNSSS